MPVRAGHSVTGLSIHAGLWTSAALATPPAEVPVLDACTLNVAFPKKLRLGVNFSPAAPSAAPPTSRAPANSSPSSRARSAWRAAGATGSFGSRRHVGPFACRDSNVALAGFEARLLVCTRALRNFEGLYDITVKNQHGELIAMFRGRSYRLGERKVFE
mgnify:CR=1 FL=1